MHIICFHLSAMSGIDKTIKTDPWLPGTTVAGGVTGHDCSCKWGFLLG